VLFTVSSCAALLAGWLYGLRQWRTAPPVQLAVATAGLALGCLTLLVAGSPAELGIGVALTGAAIPPILVLCTLLAQSAVRQSVLTQAFVWLNSASAAGSASAAAATGWAVTTFGAHGGFAVAATATSLAAVLAAAGLQALRAPLGTVPRPSTQHPAPSARPPAPSGRPPAPSAQHPEPFV
jgi:hypothetical protein